jgi:alpha-beta hydrolase superfamily lysophospholipase
MSSIDMPIESSTVVTATHQSAQTRFCDADGVCFAFRRFGRSETTPLVMLQHFRGNLDSWDPAPDRSAGRRARGDPRRLPGRQFLKRGVRPDERRHSAADHRSHHRARALRGRPARFLDWRIRRAGDRADPPGARATVDPRRDRPEGRAGDARLGRGHRPCGAETGRAQGREFLSRLSARSEDRDPPSSLAARDAQYDAIVEWGIPDHRALQRLSAICCPTLIIQGDRDRMIPTSLSHLMAGLIPDAQIRIYPNSAHAFLVKEPEQVAAEINAFLSTDVSDGRCRA